MRELAKKVGAEYQCLVWDGVKNWLYSDNYDYDVNGRRGTGTCVNWQQVQTELSFTSFLMFLFSDLSSGM